MPVKRWIYAHNWREIRCFAPDEDDPWIASWKDIGRLTCKEQQDGEVKGI